MSFFSLLSWFRGDRRVRQEPGAIGRTSRRRAVLHLEALEDRCLMSGNTISGFVYNDVNHNGLFDIGESGIAGSRIELHDASGRLIDATTTDAQGHYVFTHDPTVDVSPATLVQNLSFTELPTNWDQSGTVPQFDPSLGTLTSVEIRTQTSLTSTIRVESLDASPAEIAATVSGTTTLSGPGVAGLPTTESTTRTFQASAFDGTIDFGGGSGHDFGPVTVPGSNSATLTAPADLSRFLGTGSVTFTESAKETSSATGSANLLLSLGTKAAGQVQVVYHYIPSDHLRSGNYTIVQPSEPAGYLDGLETRGNVTPLPGTAGTDTIPITLGDSSLTNNNFGEIAPSSLSGYVYIDNNNDGIKSSGEPGVAGVPVTLTGTDDLGPVSRTAATGADGSYSFSLLRPGVYTISKTHTNGYYEGKATVGTLGGVMTSDLFSNVVVGTGATGVNYNFGMFTPSRLTGFVYVDANNNGVKEPGEQGIAGVTVTLTGSNIYGDSLVFTQLTDGNGSYTFNWLPPGVYTITETQPPGYLQGINTRGTLGGAVVNDQISGITLGAGVVGADYDFGELRPVTSPVVDGPVAPPVTSFPVNPPPDNPAPVISADPVIPGPGASLGKQWFLASTGWRSLRGR